MSKSWTWLYTQVCNGFFPFLNDRVKNPIAVTDTLSVCGKPHSITLCDNEKDMLKAVGITLDVPMLSFPQVMFTKSRRIVTTNTKTTLRDNSCIIYAKDGLCQFGILHKVIQSDNETFALVKTLIPSAEKLCRDSTTHARIDEHLLKVSLPRYSHGTSVVWCIKIILSFSQK